MNFLVAHWLLQSPEPDPVRTKQLLTPLLDHPPDDSRWCQRLAALILDRLPQPAAKTDHTAQVHRAQSERRRSLEQPGAIAPNPASGLRGGIPLLHGGLGQSRTRFHWRRRISQDESRSAGADTGPTGAGPESFAACAQSIRPAPGFQANSLWLAVALAGPTGSEDDSHPATEADSDLT